MLKCNPYVDRPKMLTEEQDVKLIALKFGSICNQIPTCVYYIETHNAFEIAIKVRTFVFLPIRTGPNLFTLSAPTKFDI